MMTKWTHVTVDEIRCPHCGAEDADERITGTALCNQCCRLFRVQSEQTFRSRPFTYTELVQASEDADLLRGYGFEVVEP